MRTNYLEGSIKTVCIGLMIQWPNLRTTQFEDGQIKITMGRKLEEEIKIVYDSPKYVQGGKSPQRYKSKVIKAFLSSWTFFKIAS